MCDSIGAWRIGSIVYFVCAVGKNLKKKWGVYFCLWVPLSVWGKILSGWHMSEVCVEMSWIGLLMMCGVIFFYWFVRETNFMWLFLCFLFRWRKGSLQGVFCGSSLVWWFLWGFGLREEFATSKPASFIFWEGKWFGIEKVLIETCEIILGSLCFQRRLKFVDEVIRVWMGNGTGNRQFERKWYGWWMCWKEEWTSGIQIFFLGMERIGEIVRSRVFVFWFCCGLFGMIEVFFSFMRCECEVDWSVL